MFHGRECSLPWGSVRGSLSRTCVPLRWHGPQVSILSSGWPGPLSPAASSPTCVLTRTLLQAAVGLASDSHGSHRFCSQHHWLLRRRVCPQWLGVCTQRVVLSSWGTDLRVRTSCCFSPQAAFLALRSARSGINAATSVFFGLELA